MDKENKSQSRLISLNIFATITTIVFAILSQTDSTFDFLKKWYIITGVVVLYLIINWNRVWRFINKIKSRIKFFLNIEVEYRRGHLEFLDKNGKKAMYNEECLLRKIKNGKLYEGYLTVTGEFSDEIHTYNCYNTLNHKKNKVTIIYGKKGNHKDRVMNTRQLQFGYALTLLDTFTAKEESWESSFNHPTKFYDLKISFNKKNPPKDADIFRVTKDDEGKEVLESLSIDPLIINKYNRVVMKVKLLHVQKGDRVRITWKWNDDKKTKPSKKKA